VPPPTQYINAEATFDLEIVDGAITKARVHRLVCHGRPAPFLVRVGANVALWFVKKEKEKVKDRPENALGVVRLLKHENGRLHVILDGQRAAQSRRMEQLILDPGDF
jgi:hypothetical protein